MSSFGVYYERNPPIFYHFEPQSDFGIIAIAAVFFFLFRIVCVRFLFPPLARLMGCTDAKELKKFNQNGFFAIYYTALTFIGYYILWNEHWIWDQNEIFRNFPQDQDHLTNPYLRPYYLAELGFYIQALFSHWFIDERLKDFHILGIHHVSTIFLISFSIITGYHRIGVWLLLLHDVVDIFLYSAKMVKACKMDNLATLLFAFFVGSYAYLRLYLFGGLVLMTIFIPAGIAKNMNLYMNSPKYGYFDDAWAPFELTSRYTCVNKYCVNTPWSLVYGMLSLVIMHIYWFSLIIYMIYKMIVTGDHVDDVREKNPHHGKQH